MSIGWSSTSDLVAGLFLIGMFYWFRFNSLRDTRSYTTAALYNFGLVCFISPFLTIYLVLLHVFPPLPATLATMVLWILPWGPRAWRNVCHGVARIPIYAYRLRDILMTADFEPLKEKQAAIQRKLAYCGFQIDDFTTAHATIIQGRVVKMTALALHIESWEVTRPNFVVRNREEYDSLLRSFDLLSFRVSRVIKQVTRVGSTLGDGLSETRSGDAWGSLDVFVSAIKENRNHRMHAVVQNTMAIILEDLRKDIDFFIESIALFIGRGVLSAGRTFASRELELRLLGFKVPNSAPSVTPALSFAVAIIAICSVIWFSTYGVAVSGSQDVGKVKILVIQALNLFGNFFVVSAFKRNFAFANEGLYGSQPTLFVVTVGLLTVLFIMPIRIAFEYYQYFRIHSGDLDRFLMLCVHSLPWSILTWATGTAIAGLSLDRTWNNIHGDWLKRLLDGLVLGFAWAGALIVVLAIQHAGFRVEGVGRGFDPSAALAFTGGLGFIIGFLIVSQLRTSPLAVSKLVSPDKLLYSH